MSPLSLSLLAALACRQASDPAVALPRMQTLQPALARIAARRVAYLRDQDWCRGIEYDRGHFSDSSHPSTCTLSGSPPSPLDAAAAQDLATFTADIRAASIPVRWATFTYGPDGALAGADLDLDAGMFSGGHLRYVWAPSAAPQDQGSEQQVTPAGQGWYVVREDWN